MKGPYIICKTYHCERKPTPKFQTMTLKDFRKGIYLPQKGIFLSSSIRKPMVKYMYEIRNKIYQ